MANIRVMLVDDEERFLRTTKKLLSRKGYDVATASSGTQALEDLASKDVDVVVLDVKMPGIDGLQTLREIKKRNPGTEVILLTGHASVDSAVEGLSFGAYDFLLKPCDIEELCLKIDSAHERKADREKRLRPSQGGS
jgi:DNA-binding NtrC family response regulator